MEPSQMMSAVEAILFASDRPVTLSRLREVLVEGEVGPTEEEIQACVKEIREKFQGPGFGFELREAQGGYQFTTKVENAPVVQKFLATKPFKLGRSALETLSIIAYRQPITRADIDKVRGIDSSHLLRVLIERGLVRMVGKAEIPGRPVVYGTTPKFLETVGLKSLGELPPLTELDQLAGDTEDPQKVFEAGLERFVQTTESPGDIQTQITEGLAQIDDMLQQAATRPDDEVYESKEAQEVAEENRAALECFQASTRARKRATKTVQYEELVASGPGAAAGEGAAVTVTEETTTATIDTAEAAIAQWEATEGKGDDAPDAIDEDDVDEDDVDEDDVDEDDDEDPGTTPTSAPDNSVN